MTCNDLALQLPVSFYIPERLDACGRWPIDIMSRPHTAWRHGLLRVNQMPRSVDPEKLEVLDDLNTRYRSKTK